MVGRILSVNVDLNVCVSHTKQSYDLLTFILTVYTSFSKCKSNVNILWKMDNIKVRNELEYCDLFL